MGVNLFFSAPYMKCSFYLSFYEYQIIQTIEINIPLSYVLALYTCIVLLGTSLFCGSHVMFSNIFF